MKRIKLLPENLINQIAAGEVIERPASAVKELVENSIDAGAKNIEIEISNGARDIRVADNGHGIHKDDLNLAFSRHATSKIKNQKDLYAINTLGFRGEALASLISVAKVSCTTRTVNDDIGLKAECKDSEIKISETGCAVGTIMEVRELFYNIPARLKFLKQPQTEMANITEIVQNIAISHPEVAINLVNKKHSIMKTSGSSDLAVTISEIYSKDLINELSEIYFEDNQFNLNVNGFISNPDFTRSNKKAIYVFANGRTVKCPIISKAIDTALKDLIPSGKYPFAVLNLSIPAEEIDVNVHPSKKEVKYTKPNLIFNFIHSAIKNALGRHAGKNEPNPYKDYNTNYSFNENPNINYQDNLEEKNNFPNTILNNTNEFKIDDYLYEEKTIPETNFNQFSEQRNKTSAIDFSQNKIELSFENNENIYFQKPKIIGQLSNTYILIDTNEGLQVVDQHIAHERFLYEQLKETKSQNSQLLLTSALINIETEQLLMLKENQDLISKYGFELDFITDTPTDTEIDLNPGVKLKRIPQILSGKNPENIILDLIEAVQTSPENIENVMLERIACSAAVKAGEKLTLWQMEELITNWTQTQYNKTCPHGRKISHTIPLKDIAKFFGRVE